MEDTLSSVSRSLSAFFSWVSCLRCSIILSILKDRVRDSCRIMSILVCIRSTLLSTCDILILFFGYGNFSLRYRREALKLSKAQRTSISLIISSLPQPESSRFSMYSMSRSEEHTSELQSRLHLVCRLLLEAHV